MSLPLLPASCFLTVPLEIPASDHTRRYLKTKKDKLGHTLSSV